MEIMNYKPIGKGCLLARFDVRIPKWGLTIRECGLFEKEGHKWVGLPNRQFKSRDGVTKNFELLVFDKPTKQRFEEAIIEKVNAGQFQRGLQETAVQSQLF